ncbi:MAG: hypothetical protein D6762_09290 [Candidatus Neomarinimicrobiota bacterium]|nr:MAG: hypothetical protein D6762_09290 [Candidatus Neomarinimicrobiota bacterium]
MLPERRRRKPPWFGKPWTCWRSSMRSSLIGILLGAILLAGPSEQIQQEFLAGNLALQAENYEQAVRHYETILAKGFEQADLYYNLGNAYYRLGWIGKAVWAYEKGKQLAPRDEDIAYNLELVNARLPDHIELPDLPWIVTWYRAVKHLFTLGDLLVAGSLLLLLSGLFWSIRIWKQDWQEWSTTAALVGVILALAIHLVALDKYWEITDTREAVIIAPEVAAYSAPLERPETIQFKIHEGTKVKVDQSQPGWIEITLLDGKKGWIRDRAALML